MRLPLTSALFGRLSTFSPAEGADQKDAEKGSNPISSEPSSPTTIGAHVPQMGAERPPTSKPFEGGYVGHNQPINYLIEIAL